MTSRQSTVDRQATPPFALRIFYREGAYPSTTDLDPTSRRALPPNLTLHAWQTTTLLELTHLLTTLLSQTPHSPLPTPAIGTRLCFRLVYPDTRPAPPPHRAINPPSKFLVRELGSVVLGGDLDVDSGTEMGHDDDDGGGDGDNRAGKGLREGKNGEMTRDDGIMLSDARFVIGDFIAVAVLPPLRDGRVAPVVRDMGAPVRGSAAAGMGMGGGGGVNGRTGRGFDGGRGRMDGGGRGGGGFGMGRSGGGFGNRGAGAGGLPSGEWRRGEQPPPGGGRGIGFRGGRW